MKLVDRYVAAVGRELPPKQADEIMAELKDALLSKIEDREAELNRPMTDKEVGQLLTDFGHPLIVAGRYRKTRYLIGPELFPMWFATMRFILGFAAALFLLALVVAAVSTREPPQVGIERALAGLWPMFIWVFGGVTLVFAVNERMGRYRFKLAFNPRQLPPPRAKARRPAQIVGEMVVGAVALLWWAGLIRFRAIMPIPAFLGVHLASTWDAFRAPIAAYLVVEMLINGLALLRPAWVRLTAALSLAKWIAGGVIVLLVIQAGHWVQIEAYGIAPSVREMIEQGFDHGMRLGLGVSLVVMAVKALGEAVKLWRSLGGDGHAGNGAAAAAR